jgi:hypothetical protein
MKTSVVMIVMVLLLGACKKKGRQEQKDVPVEDSTVATVQLSPQFDANPYDSAGYWHNEMLRYMRRFKAGSQQLSAGQIVDLLIGNPTYGLSLSVREPMLTLLQQVHAAQEVFYDQVVAAIGVSSEAKQHLMSIAGAVSQYFGRNYNAMKSAIVGVEQLVLDRIEIPQQERILILMAASIARYSGYYWTVEEPINLAGLKLKDLLKAVATVTGDPAGFITKWFGGGSGFKESVAYGAACSEYYRKEVDYIPTGN